jgi:hypothetical protein
MQIKRAIPHPVLQHTVRLFEERRIDVGSAVLSWPVPASPHQILDIHPPHSYCPRQRWPGEKPAGGFCGRTADRFPRSHLSVRPGSRFHNPISTSRPQSVDWHRHALVNEVPVATDILGMRGVGLADAVRTAPHFAARVCAAERLLEAILSRRAILDKAISFTSSFLLETGGQIRIDY